MAAEPICPRQPPAVHIPLIPPAPRAPVPPYPFAVTRSFTTYCTSSSSRWTP
jgi:hypothetical protein